MGDSAITVNHIILGFLEVEVGRINPSIPTGKLSKELELAKTRLQGLGVTPARLALAIRSQCAAGGGAPKESDGPTMVSVAPSGSEVFSKADSIAHSSEPGIVHFLAAAMQVSSPEIAAAVTQLGTTPLAIKTALLEDVEAKARERAQKAEVERREADEKIAEDERQRQQGAESGQRRLQLCDVCGGSGTGTIVPARQMSSAVGQGFNPFVLGLMPADLTRRAQESDFSQRWAQSAISGDTSTSNWNVCSACMSKLSAYISPVKAGKASPQPEVPAPSRTSSPASPKVAIAVRPGQRQGTSTVLPGIQGRASAEVEDIKKAIHDVVRGSIVLVALSILKAVVCSLLRTRIMFLGMTLNEWGSGIISLCMVWFAGMLFQPVKAIVAFYVAAFVRAGKIPGGERCLGNLVAVSGKGVLLVFFLFLYRCVLPLIVQFSSAVMHGRDLTALLNVLVLLAVVGLLFLMWRDVSPVVDYLSGHITDKVTGLSGAVASAECPSCKTRNDCGAAFCFCCGTPMPQQAAELAPKDACPRCAADNPPSSKFCYQCGAPLN
jgi:hypothetical protein